MSAAKKRHQVNTTPTLFGNRSEPSPDQDRLNSWIAVPTLDDDNTPQSTNETGIVIGPVILPEEPEVVAEKQPVEQKTEMAIDSSIANEDAVMENDEDWASESATRVMTAGYVMDYFLEQFRRIHVGDEIVMSILLFTACCQQILNSFGIHPALDGVQGSGKSSSVRAGLFLFPPEFVYDGSFSAKGLFYDPLKRGTIIFSDDCTPPDGIIEIMKRAMTAYHEETRHKTVSKDRTPQEFVIPPETVFILTSVGSSKDSQLRDRQMAIPLDKNPELDSQYVEFLTQRALHGDITFALTDGATVCRQMMRHIKSKHYTVVVPYAERIVFSKRAKANRRAMNNFVDFIYCSAVLNYLQREHSDNGSITDVIASEEDFKNAILYFPNDASVWDLKLNKTEAKILKLLYDLRPGGMTETDITQQMGMNKSHIYRILHGDRQKNIAGLVDKAPITFDKVYDVETGRYSNVFTVTNNVLSIKEDFATLLPVSS